MLLKLPSLAGLIRRRILVNFRADPEIVQRLLPAPFRPKLYNGHAIVGICLIRLEQIRPAIIPYRIGFASENAAHRIAVQWRADETEQEGVFIPRRDTGSLLNHIAGGRLFPGEHMSASFQVVQTHESIDFQMQSRDGTEVKIKGIISDRLPESSTFSDLNEASNFFRTGNLGFSVRRNTSALDGILLETSTWNVRTLNVSDILSTWYDDPSRFPPDSITFDHALIMQNIPHRWLAAEAPACPC